MGPLIGSIIAAAFLSTAFWLLTTRGVYRLGRRFVLLHLVTIYLTVISFLLLNLFTFVAVMRWFDQFALSLLYGFLMGIQAVAAISAFLFVRSATGGRR